MAITFKNTDQLWGAVIAKLPNEIQEKVSAPAGKPYIHIKPQSKHLGIKDFKYCVEYSSKAEKASMHVESLNGGEEAKAKIQKFIDCHEDGHILDGVVPQQGAKNNNKWSWEVATPANELNEELVQWYIDTINAFYEFFETPLNGAIEEQEDNSNVELADIAKDAVVFLSFTQNEGEEYICYLYNLIKDGAMYDVEENYGDFELPGDGLYDVADLHCYSENIEDEYEDVESMAEQLVKDFVEARWFEYEQDNGALAIDDEYTITIFVGDNKVYEQTVCKSVESGNGWWTNLDDDEENDENSSEEEYPLIEKLRKAFIVETDDEVYYDAESADEYTQDQFINNIKAQMTDDEVEAFESLQWKGAEAFTNYLEDCPDDFDLRQMIITAAYCTRQCMDIDDDTRLYVDEQLYYFNDCRDFHYKYEVDIDLG